MGLLLSWVVLPRVSAGMGSVPDAERRGAAGREGIVVNWRIVVNCLLRAGTDEVRNLGGSAKGKAGHGESLSCPGRD